jgi:PBP1b-binding outer membrane lipoprotein LpoB
MKKIISLLALVFILNSCSTDDNSGPKYLFEFARIESVDIPTEMVVGSTYHIVIHYRKPSTCHYYNGFYYEKDGNVRTIAVESAVVQSNNCQLLTDEIADCSFDFYATTEGSYVFKFYQGKDDQGNNIFLQYEIPVTN